MIELLKRNADNSAPEVRTYTVPAAASRRFEDVLFEEFGFQGAAALRITAVTGSILVSSRTYNLLGAANAAGLPPGATFGQFVEALAPSDAVAHGEEGRIIYLSHRPSLAGGFRVNLGLVNATAFTASVEVELRTDAGATLGTLSRTLGPLAYIQIDKVFEQVTTAPVDNGYAVLRTPTEGGAFFAQAYVIDNHTGDPIALSAVKAPAAAPVGSVRTASVATAGQTLWTPTAGHLAGAKGSNWRTNAAFHNPGATATAFRVQLLARDQQNTSSPSVSLSLPAGQSVLYQDVLDTLFSFTGAAALRVSVTSGTVMMVSHTYNLLGEGNSFGLPAGATFGQFVRAFTPDEEIAIGQEARLIHLAHDPTLTQGNRTNISLVRTTGGGGIIAVEVDLHDGAGALLGTVTESLRGFEYRQLDKVFEQVTTAAVEDGYAVVRTTTAGGRLLAQAYVIDNITSDPISVNPATSTPATTMGMVESVNELMAFLSIFDDHKAPPLDDAIASLQAVGIDALLATLPPTGTDFLSRVADGALFSYGTGTDVNDGSVASGSITARFSNSSNAGDSLRTDFELSFNDFRIDGRSFPMAGVGGSWEFHVGAAGVVGDVTFGPPSATSAADRAADEPDGTLEGTLHFDTAACPAYPVSGTLTFRANGVIKTVTITPSCDGRFGYSIPGAEHYRYDMTYRDCGGAPSPPGQELIVFLLAEGGSLTPDPAAPPGYGPDRYAAYGLIEDDTSVALYFEEPFSSVVTDRRIAGLFTGYQAGAGTEASYFLGTADYAYAQRSPLPECSVVYQQKQGDPDVFQALQRCPDGPCVP